MEPSRIKDIKDRIQFLVTVEIFFSTLVFAFFKMNGGDDVISNKNALAWGIGVAFCILNYLFVSGIDESQKRALVWIRGSVSFNLILFFLPISLLILVLDGPISPYYKVPFSISLVGSLFMPIATFLLIIVFGYWQALRRFFFRGKISN